MKICEYVLVGSLAVQATVQPLGAGADSLKSKLDSLIGSRTEYELRIRVVQKKIDSLGAVIDLREARRAQVSIESRANRSMALYPEATAAAGRLCVIPKGTKVLVIGAEGNYFKVTYQGRTGYVIYWEMELNDDLRRMIAASRLVYDSEEQKEIRRKAEGEKWAKRDAEIAAEEERRSQLELTARWIKTGSANVRNGAGENSRIIGHISMGGKVYVEDTKGNWARVAIQDWSTYEITEDQGGAEEYWISTSLLSKEVVWPPSEEETRREKYCRDHPEISGEFRRAILNGLVMIGMTKEMLRASWGYPEDVNRTVLSGLVTEQWVYSMGVYVYLENGVVTAWQD